MRSLLKYIYQNYAFLLFLLLEIISISMVVSYNKYAKAKFLNSSNVYVGAIYERTNNIREYFSLRKANEELAKENAKLKSFFLNKGEKEHQLVSNITDTLKKDSLYHLITAKVIRNSVHKPYNYITLNKGRNDGVEIDQSVIGANGVVGVIVDVSESYALAMSLLNPRWSISAKIKKNNYYGLLIWDGNNYQTAELTEIPNHVNVLKGDSIVTSAYSSIFPEGILIGEVIDYKRVEGENNLTIKVKLSTDFKSLTYVDIVNFIKKDEIEMLENNIQDE